MYKEKMIDNSNLQEEGPDVRFVRECLHMS